MKTLVLIVVVVSTLAAFSVAPALGVMAALAWLAVTYLYSCKRRPTASHRSCGGSGKSFGMFWTRANRGCGAPYCHGGQVIRPGARLVAPDVVARVLAGDK